MKMKCNFDVFGCAGPAPQVIKVIKIQGGPPSGGQGWPTGGIWPSADHQGTI